MKPSPRHARPAALLLAATLLLLLAPAAPNGVVAAAAAQRRRSAPRRPSAPQTTAPAPAATPSEPQRPQPQDVERPFDTSVAADSYVVYVELRGLGQLAQTSEVRAGLDAFRLMGEAPRQLMDLIDFLTANEEALATVRVVAAAMPTRAGLPDGVSALQFPTPEAARLFEPKLRALFEQLGDAPGPQPGAAPKRGTTRRLRQAKKTPPLVLKRAGSWLYVAPQAFTFKSLKGDGAASLADNPRLQSFRSRLASESLFVYYETWLWRRMRQTQLEQMQKEQSEYERAAGTTTTAETAVATIPADPVLIPDDERPIHYGPAKDSPPPAAGETAATLEAATPTPEETATPELTEGEAALAEMMSEAARAEAANAAKDAESAPPPPPMSAEERAARSMLNTLVSGIFGGMVREPEALAVGLNLEGDALVARLLVSRAADAPNNIIPFFPNVVAGPPVTTESLSVAPADSEVFVSASFDWPRIYDSLINTLNTKPPRYDPEARDGGETADGPEDEAVMRPASAEKGVEAMEKLFGFRLREDLLAALGSEVALSVPADWFEGRRRFLEETDEPGADGEKMAEPGPVAIISLNNPDAVRRMMPLVLAALGLGPPPQPAAPPERRGGLDIHHLGPGAPAYAFVGNFLVVGETAPAVRHLVDAYASNRTLASSTRFREATAWQEQQRLAFGYVSDGLMRRYVDATKKTAEGSTDPVTLAALAQLDVPLDPASYSTTDEGDALLHELHVPVSLAKVFAASAVIGTKEAPVLMTEMSAVYTLQRVHSAQTSYKEGKGQGRFGTLEELYAAKLLDKDDPFHAEYAFDLRVSGDTYTHTATPRNYGKTGRRSFFSDQTGTVRGANHKGEPATAADPPVEQY